MVVSEESTGKRKDNAAIELVLARLLRLGSLFAAALLVAGIGSVLVGAGTLAPTLITYGLLVLLGTPVLRVLAAGIIFIREKEWDFALFSLVVLLSLAVGIVLGSVG